MSNPTLIVVESTTQLKDDFDIFAFMATLETLTELPAITTANSHQSNPKVNEAILLPRNGADNLLIRVDPPMLSLSELADTEKSALMVRQYYVGLSEMVKQFKSGRVQCPYKHVVVYGLPLEGTFTQADFAFRLGEQVNEPSAE